MKSDDDCIERTMAMISDDESSSSTRSPVDIKGSKIINKMMKKLSVTNNLDDSSSTNRRTSTTTTASASGSGSTSIIENRMEHIKDILKGNILKPMIDFDNSDTENFTNKIHYHDDDDKCNDVRCLIGKKFLNMKYVFNQMNVKLIYIKSGTTGHTFKATSKSGNSDTVFAFKVVAYPKKEYYGDMYDAQRPENAELMMIKLLSYFVVTKMTPHIVLPIGTFNTSITPFLNLPKSRIDSNPKKYNRFEKFVKKCKNNEFENYVSVLISEWADGGDLLEYIRSSCTKSLLSNGELSFFKYFQYWPLFRENIPHLGIMILRLIIYCYKKQLIMQEKIVINIPSIR